MLWVRSLVAQNFKLNRKDQPHGFSFLILNEHTFVLIENKYEKATYF